MNLYMTIKNNIDFYNTVYLSAIKILKWIRQK